MSRADKYGYSVFSIPPGVIYRPAESKLRNAGRVDYLGSSKVIAAQDTGDQFTGFQGARNQKAAYNNTSAPSQAAGGLGRMNSVMLKTPSSNAQNIPQQRRPAEPTQNGSPYTIIPPKRMDSRERLVGTPPNAQGLYPYTSSTRAYTPDGRPYTPDGRPHTPDPRSHTPDSRPYTPDGRPYTPDPNYNQQGIAASQAARNQYTASNLSNQGQNQQLPPIPPKSTRRTSSNNNNHQRRISDQGNNQALSPLPPGFTPSPSNSTSSTPHFPPYELESPDPFRRPRRSRERDSLIREAQASTSTPNFPNHHQSSSSTSSSEARRVDSGFESTHEDRLSSHSRSSSGSASNNIRGPKDAPPPMPSMPSSRQDEWSREREGERERDRSRDRERDHRQPPRAPATHQRNNSAEAGGYYDEMDGILDGIKDISVVDEGTDGRSTKIKIKLHYSDTRVLLVPSTIDFTDLTRRVQEKFDAPSPLRLSYHDEENELVLMIDQEDFQMAKAISRAKETGAVGAVEKLELWCF
ncbi:hypothetical protein BC937DRAFT_86512, partial [Endogone sp. FLAS-F59071]